MPSAMLLLLNLNHKKYLWFLIYIYIICKDQTNAKYNELQNITAMPGERRNLEYSIST